MEFLKKHYEKIILSAVLLGLGAAAVWLSLAVGQAKSEMTISVAGAPPSKPWKEADLQAQRAALEKLTHPPTVVLSGEHNLFNPVTWKMRADGTLVKFTVQGAAALVVTEIRPLYFQIGYERKEGDGYYLNVTTALGKKSNPFATLNEKEKTRQFIIRGTEGATNDPTGLKLEITGEPDLVLVTKDNPFKRVEGYEADLKYDLDNKTVTKQKAGETIWLGDTPYKIVAITNNAVTVQDIRTTQRTIIPWSGAH